MADRAPPQRSSTENLEIIFYDPGQNLRPAKQVTTQPKWRELVERIGISIGTRRLEAQAFLDCAPEHCNERPLATAFRLAHNVHGLNEEKPIRELLLLSLCSVLSISGRAAPEELDEVLKVLVRSSEPRYLDRLKKGAKFANELIAEWAVKGVGTERERLDRATQAIFQGTFSFLHP